MNARTSRNANKAAINRGKQCGSTATRITDIQVFGFRYHAGTRTGSRNTTKTPKRDVTMHAFNAIQIIQSFIFISTHNINNSQHSQIPFFLTHTLYNNFTETNTPQEYSLISQRTRPRTTDKCTKFQLLTQFSIHNKKF